MYSTLTIVMLSLALLRQVTPTPDHHKNVADLQVLCDLMNLAKGSIDTQTVEQIPESALDELERINISLADPKWRSTLAATAKDKKKDSPDCKTPADKEVCKPHYSRWEDHNIAVLEDTKGQKFPNIGKDKLESTLGRSIAITVSGLAAKANTVRDTFNAKLAGERTATPTNVLNLLAKAAYKAETADDAQSKECKVTLGSTRATDCALPKGATAVCETLLCVCAQDSTQNKELSGATASPNGKRGAWGESEKADKWNAIKSVCNAADPPKLTPTYIRQTLTAALNRIHHCGKAGGEAMVIGTAHTDCSCQTQDAVCCVRLDDMQYKTTAKPTGSINWATLIEQTADALQGLELLAAERDEAVATIVAITAEAGQNANALQHRNLVLTPLLNQKPQQSAVAQKEDCEAIKTPDQRRSKDDCEWNDKATGEEKRCKLNTTAVAKASQAGTGDGASGSDPNCSQYTDPEQFAKTPGKPKDGKKSVCGWIENTCKDSCFHVAMKFSLIAAAFMR